MLLFATLATACSFRPRDVARDAARSDAPWPDATAPDAGDASSAWPMGWAHRKAIVVDGAQVSGGPFTRFVLLVRWSADPDLAGAAQQTGADLRFTTQGGQVLPYERAHYDPGGGLVAWVQLPTLDAAGTTIYLYYGNLTAPDQQDRDATWDGSYAGVWHLDEPAAATMLADATKNANTATPMNAPTLAQPGVAGEAVAFNGIDNYLKVPQSPSLMTTTGEATFALWIWWTAPLTTHYQRILTSSNRFTGPGSPDGYEWAVQPAGGGDGYYLYPQSNSVTSTYNLVTPSPFKAQTWQYAVATLDFTHKDVELYLDGQPLMFTTSYAMNWTLKGMPGDWLWGSNAETTDPTYMGAFGGMLDEIQVMTGVRSAGWIQTSYANQRPDQTFYTVGAAEDAPVSARR